MTQRLLSDARVGRIRARLDAADALAVAACEALVAQAEAALDLTPPSVRDNDGSPHFRVDAAYVGGRDGVRNTEANHKSRHLMLSFSHACRDLALAWRITGESRYAEKALEMIHVWCINQNTRMIADGFVQDAATPGAIYGGDIVLFFHLAPAFMAMHLLDGFAGWNLHCRAAVRRWVREMVEPQRRLMFFEGRPMYNNWEDARLMYLAAGALALDDMDLLIEVFDRWRAIIPEKMTDEGQLPRETMRTRSMHYTLFALNSTAVVAEIAAAHGVDLYGYSINGRSLKLAVDYAAGYLLDMERWPFEMINPLSTDNAAGMAVFEMALARWGDRRYLEVIEAWGGRPVVERHATLLFGLGAEG